MWSGPRNISTAMMRSFGSRADTVVSDEPLYAHYLNETGLEHHPGRDEVIASQPTDWKVVVDELTGPLPDGKTVWYQKHMAHHLLPDVGRAWLRDVTNCFLLRDPYGVVASFAKVVSEPTLADLGLAQQVEIFTMIREETGVVPAVVDAADLLSDPAWYLARLCASVGIGFDTAMLSWAPGRRATDGVWAKHWYGAVEQSTGFSPPRDESQREPLPPHLQSLYEECLPYYEELHRYRFTKD